MKFIRTIFFVCFSISIVTSQYIYADENDVPELRYMNRSADPCEDFYEYTCGNFENIRPRPEEEPIWDHFVILQKEIHQTARSILLSKRQPEEAKAVQKSKAFYTACINVDYSDDLKLAEAKVVKDIGGWPLIGTDFDSKRLSWEYIGDIIANFGLSLFFDIQVGPNLFTGKENAIWLFQDRMPNPATIIDRPSHNYENYLDHPDIEKRSAEPFPFEEFVRNIALKVKKEMGTYKTDEEIFQDVTEVIDFMRTLMKGGIIDTDLDSLSPIPTMKELQNWTDKQFGGNSGMNWLSFLSHVFKLSGITLNENMRIMTTSPSMLYGIINLFRLTEPRLLQNFIMVRLFTYTAPDSDHSMREAFDTYYHKQGYTVHPRSEYCLRKTLGYPGFVDFSMALTYAYQRYHFNINKLQQAADMIQDLHDAFIDILNDATWIDDETREKAAVKAQKMITLLGYPEYVEEIKLLDEFYGNLRICTWDHFGNSQRLRAFRQALQFRQIGGPRNRALWQNSPLEVNAFYNHPNNRIVLPISILDPVFFNGQISALDYGRIGAIIGHEITHGFDNKGKSYDENGGMGNLWSPATNASFYEKVECFLNQYSNYYIGEIQSYVNATQTLDENLADNGGLREAFLAFQKLKKRQSQLVTVKDFTPEQLFFIGFGTMWCMQESNYYLTEMNNYGKYAPGRFRVIGAVSNNEFFAQAFNCPVGSAMNPVDKCVLW